MQKKNWKCQNVNVTLKLQCLDTVCSSQLQITSRFLGGVTFNTVRVHNYNVLRLIGGLNAYYFCFLNHYNMYF